MKTGIIFGCIGTIIKNRRHWNLYQVFEICGKCRASFEKMLNRADVFDWKIFLPNSQKNYPSIRMLVRGLGDTSGVDTVISLQLNVVNIQSNKLLTVKLQNMTSFTQGFSTWSNLITKWQINVGHFFVYFKHNYLASKACSFPFQNTGVLYRDWP